MGRRRVLVVIALIILAILSSCCLTIWLFRSAPPPKSEAIELERHIQSRLGSVLETVAVTPMRFWGVTDDSGADIVGFKITYRLKECPALVSNFTSEGEFYADEFMLPRPKRMTPAQYRELLRAYAKVTDRPFGAMESYSRWRSVAPTITIAGKQWQTKRLWVVAPGFTEISEIRPRAPYPASGCLFVVPESGEAQLITKMRDSGVLNSDIGD